MSITECQCDRSGYCAILGRHMSEVRHNECKNKPHYFEMFLSEAGKKKTPLPIEVPLAPCTFRSGKIGTIECRTCTGGGFRHVYKCQIHGQCTDKNVTPKNLQNKKPHACSTCEEYKMLTQPQLTIAIATLNEWEGLWSTVTSLFNHHAESMRHCELLVIDQDCESKGGKLSGRYATRKMRERVSNRHLYSCRYIPDRSTRGIGPVRNKLFAEATADYVLVLDSHVDLDEGVLKRLLWYYTKHPESRDLLTGPLLSDGGGFVGTHQELQWRGESLGTWAKDRRAFNANSDPFEIPTQGLGLFSCRRDAFPGFSKQQRGFGCAEALFCQMFRDRGDRVLCHPGLRWLHRFGERGGQLYELLAVDKLINYMLEFQRTRMDPSGMFEHFEGKLNADDYTQMMRTLSGVTK